MQSIERRTHLVIKRVYVTQTLLKPDNLQGITRAQVVGMLDNSICNLLHLAAVIGDTLQRLYRRQVSMISMDMDGIEDGKTHN